jgi:hypothetical protein
LKKLQSPSFKYPSPPSLSKRSEAAALVNFLNRVASNRENGRNGQTDKSMDRLSKIFGASFMASSTEIAQDRKEIRGDRREIKGDRHELRRDHRERRGDRRELHGDKRELRRDISDYKASN